MRLRVDWRAAVALVGTVLTYLAVPLAVPLALAVADSLPALADGVGAFLAADDVVPFLATILLTLVTGTALRRLDPASEVGTREGFLMVALSWLVVPVLGSVPFLLTAYGVPGLTVGYETTLRQPANALFESTSGFTTTGATVLGEISIERHTRALMLWRQLIQWLGGMGIVVLAVAVLPELSVGGAQLLEAEAPGPSIEKLAPRVRETARRLWLLYAGITAAEILLLYAVHLAGLAPNMTAYNAVAHGLTTMPTGGFSPEARSIEAFSAVAQWVIVPFMFAAGVNFALFYAAATGRARRLVSNPEFRTYLGVIVGLTALTSVLLFTDPLLSEPLDTPSGFVVVGNDAEGSLRHAAFQVVSLTNSTGYSSMDFTAWSGTRQYVLVFAMLIGGSAGSTGGGIKVVRWIVVAKLIRRELYTAVHPEAVEPIRLGDRVLDDRTVRGILGFTMLYLILFFAAALFIAVDASRVGLDLSTVEVVTASIATIGNIGPGLGVVGPMGSYTAFPATTKLLMVGLMWIGRLEILPVLVLLTRSYWQS
ncbi:potassium transporter TrkH [Halobacteriales archaeon SW_5_70_135]|nr:MAG: potassium transporter TrkH [Halobacteriales archaeon SW_5_70_135]